MVKALKESTILNWNIKNGINFDSSPILASGGLAKIAKIPLF